jgi:DNA polymerase V
MKAVILGPATLNPTSLNLPLYSPRVSAGQSRFASAAQGYELESLDLNQRYIVNPPATFLVKCEGDSMINAGIMPGAVLVVDRSIKPKSSQVIVAEVDGEFLVKTLYKRGNVIRLLSENPAYPAIEFKEGHELVVWGVVTAVINEFYAPYFRTR